MCVFSRHKKWLEISVQSQPYLGFVRFGDLPAPTAAAARRSTRGRRI